MTLSLVQILGLLNFIFYFLINIGLLVIVGSSVYSAPGFGILLKEKKAWRTRSGFHLGLAVGSFLHTWYCELFSPNKMYSF